LGSYAVSFHSFNAELFKGSYFLIDDKLESQLNLQKNNCLFVEAREINKNLRLIEDIMVELSTKGMTKNDELVVIGGGFLQDIGTLVASLYMRGVKWKYVPTTLAAMGDSCIGGKSSINAGEVKNLVGNFYPPKAVFIDPLFVTTLPELEIVAGISEIMKICFARSKDHFVECTKILSNWQAHQDKNSLSDLIQLSLNCKRYFVVEDEFDTGLRKLLNFGHSFGHALEAATNFSIPHGVAVLIGMIAACNHPRTEKSDATKLLIQSCLKFCRSIGKEISTELSNLNYEVFSRALAKDKKNSNSDLILILPINSELQMIEIPFKDNALADAESAMKAAIDLVMNEIR
jgi:3-dehydroquinate synthase